MSSSKKQSAGERLTNAFDKLYPEIPCGWGKSMGIYTATLPRSGSTAEKRGVIYSLTPVKDIVSSSSTAMSCFDDTKTHNDFCSGDDILYRS